MSNFESKDIITDTKVCPYIYHCDIIKKSSDTMEYKHIELLSCEKDITNTDYTFIYDDNFLNYYNDNINNEIMNKFVPKIIDDGYSITNINEFIMILFDNLNYYYDVKESYFSTLYYLFQFDNDFDRIKSHLIEHVVGYIEYIKRFNRITIITKKLLTKHQFMVMKHLCLIRLRTDMENVKVLVTKESLDSIPVIKYDDEKISDDVKKKNSTCHICLEDFDKDSDIRFIQCNHLFHKDCIDKWISTESYKCPICRKEVSEGKPDTNNNYTFYINLTDQPPVANNNEEEEDMSFPFYF